MQQISLMFLFLKTNRFCQCIKAPPGVRDPKPRYDAPGDLRVELVENAVINIGLVRLSPREWPKIGRGTTK